MQNKRDNDRLSFRTEKDVGTNMMDQYKKETSQIHAPVDLVQKTKLAMEQEELRLKEAAERTDRPKINVETCRETESAKRKPKSVFRIHQWTLPLTAAAAILILVSVSAVTRNGRLSHSDSDMMADTGYEKSMDIQFSEAATTEEAEEDNELPMNEGPDKPNRSSIEESDAVMEESAEGAEWESSDVIKETEEMTGADEQTNRANAAKQEQGAEIEITQVEEEPDFYDNPDTEDYLYENLIFWADQDENGEWFAYVSVRGDKYVIVSAITDQDVFLEKAYELVLETRGSLK